jgi:hypothetical protein
MSEFDASERLSVRMKGVSFVDRVAVFRSHRQEFNDVLYQALEVGPSQEYKLERCFATKALSGAARKPGLVGGIPIHHNRFPGRHSHLR